MQVNGVDKKVCLRRLLHLLSHHKAVIKAAIDTGMLDGIQGLLAKIDGSQNLTKEELIGTWSKKTSTKETLSPSSSKEDPLITWLKKHRHSDTKEYKKD
jgi:hypothetical protein